ncbi:hypothetical protein ANCDUO_12196 [Ancylostoma duodenale]|uniref:Uncharacterized protein n=1 Tax=Ancylostoma duodenale TaxID=51022 RepID=A0A0C2G9F9_9BILA|nr:hypothetical protein ANCDUO_12196 [Ancylostoma duodenale]
MHCGQWIALEGANVSQLGESTEGDEAGEWDRLRSTLEVRMLQTPVRQTRTTSDTPTTSDT